MSALFHENLFDPPAVDRLAAVVDPEAKRRIDFIRTMTEASNEIYRRTIRDQERNFDEMFIVSATTKESLRVIGKAIGLYEDDPA
jgi:hypothetical protein